MKDVKLQEGARGGEGQAASAGPRDGREGATSPPGHVVRCVRWRLPSHRACRPERVEGRPPTPSASGPRSDYVAGTGRIIRVRLAEAAGNASDLRVVLRWFEILKQNMAGG